MKIKTILFLFFLLSVLVHLASVSKVGSVLWGDALYYFAYTRSIVVDGDINFSNEASHPIGGFPNEPEVSNITGKVTNKFSPGVAVLWIPGFSVGYLITHVFNFLFETLRVGQPLDTTGYGFIPLFFVSVSNISFSIAGLYFCIRTLQELGFSQVVKKVLLLLFFTTPIFYYTAVDPVNSHPASFMLSALLLFLLVRILKTQATWQKAIFAGIVGGLLILVRNQDFVLTLPFAVMLLTYSKNLQEKINNFVLFYGTAFVVFSVQLFVTLELFGLFTSPYLHRGEQLYWLQPDFMRVFFSQQNGLFFFSPILLFAVIGFAYLLKSTKRELQKKVGFFSFIAFLLASYVIAAWGPEIIGGPYGSRMFLSTMPYLSVGLAAVVYLLKQQLKQKFIYVYSAFGAVLFVNMLFQTAVMLITY